MRLGIDARLNAYRGGGIPHYTRQLLGALAPLLAEQEHLVALQHYKQQRPLLEGEADTSIRCATLITPPHHRLEQWTLPLELFPRRLSLVHFPDFIAPRLCPCATVITIHDLAFFHYPEILDDQARRYYGQVRNSAWHADAVIAVSKSTRRDISNVLDLPPERVDVVYEAAAPLFVPCPPAAGETRTVGQLAPNAPPTTLAAGTFGLFVSTLEPRKNLPMLLRALRICRDRRPATPYRLVVVGARGWRDEPIFEAVRNLRLGDAVVFVGSVSPPELLWLYNACVFYANPSRYEGFGLPVLEALACGAPTLAAAASSLPEVAGEAALLLPPDEPDAWADAIERAWHDAAWRANMAQRGPSHAARFSWQRAARETLAIYRRVGQMGEKQGT